MSAFFNNKTIFPEPGDILSLNITVGSQPSVTGLYIDSVLSKTFKNNVVDFELGEAAQYQRKKIKIHTSVQDKNENTDKIFVHHIFRYGNQSVEKQIDLTAEEEGDLFDMHTDISIY